ncbi:hypothetical protein CI109_106871 [Kwoniella shandongensis]|uniref:Uncharacterized protein n=1 Tax=Kwoniella shandongensis TaxID=1734106 RepID=A0A5M6C6P1_9TREE|nr:uncharacterized protein CI109_000873 [Kwoniella shandongensis]KAA5530693.1 hypothetical protein CI109_000873 [Kwoniella shandongensis]
MSIDDSEETQRCCFPPTPATERSRPTTPWTSPSSSSTRNRAATEVPSDNKANEMINQPFIRASSALPFASAAQGVPSDWKVNEDFIIPNSHQTAQHWGSTIKIERKSPAPTPCLLTPISQSNRSPYNEGKMEPPVCTRPSSSSLGKRKENPDVLEASERSRVSTPSVVIKRERAPSSAPDIKPSIPIPILPLPLPSKRFKKDAKSRALLIPVEQLPVFPLPPLPTVDDPDLVQQVFSHQSLFEKVKGRFEDPIDCPAKHYEKLEHVGDSILGMVVTTWLHETKPRLTIGTATKLKSHMVSNATLSHLSGLYNLPQRLNGDPNLLPVLRAETDVRAALMEAYIAALYFSFPIDERITEGMQVIDSWLREMYEPLYDFFFDYMKNEHDQHHMTIGATLDGHVQLQSDAEIARIDAASLGMAQLVQLYTAHQDRELRYEEERYETNIGALWKIKVTVDGIELGEAVRPVKKMAKNVAAWEAAKKLGLVIEGGS